MPSQNNYKNKMDNTNDFDSDHLYEVNGKICDRNQESGFLCLAYHTCQCTRFLINDGLLRYLHDELILPRAVHFYIFFKNNAEIKHFRRGLLQANSRYVLVWVSCRDFEWRWH